MSVKKKETAKEMEKNNKLSMEYNNVTSRMYHLLREQWVPFVQDTEVRFKEESIRIDFIIFASSPIFFYMTLSNENEDPEINKIKEFCDKADIKLIIRYVKEDNSNLFVSYGTALTLLLSKEQAHKLVVC